MDSLIAFEEFEVTPISLILGGMVDLEKSK